MSRRAPGHPVRAMLLADLLEDRVVPSFTTPVIFATGLDNPGSVATGDLNGDGKPDLAVTNYGASGGGHSVAVFFNNGSGGFPATPNHTLDTGANGASYVTIADLTGDSANDIIAVSAPASGNSKVSVFTNKGGTSGFNTLTPVDSGGTAGNWLAVGDVNADGKPDVVVSNGGTYTFGATGNNAVVFTNDGTGVLTNAATLAMPVPGGFAGAGLPRAVAIADVNGDSKSDIVVATANPSFGAEANSTVNTFPNTATGTSVAFGTAIASDAGDLGVFGMVVADFDANGKPDVIVAHAGTTAIGAAGDGSVSVLLNSNNSDSKFQSPNLFLADKRIFAVAVGDFNGAKGTDFAAIEFPNRSSNGPLHVYLNVGTGKAFTADPNTTTDTGIIGPQFINAGDFNSDGKPDLVVVGENNQGVTYQNVGASPPAAPTGLNATPGNAQVVLTWNLVSGATTYNIYRGTSSGGETLFQTGVTTNTFTDTGLTNGTTYYYQVTAVNAAGESTRSNEASATPQAAPPAPTGLTASPGNAQVVLNWNSAVGATSYNIYRGTVSGSTTLIQTGVTGTTFTNTGLTNGTTYYYQVTAVNVGGESPKSNEVSATPQAPPAAPTGLSATPGNAQVVLNWNASSGATSYNIYRGTSSGGATLFQAGVTGTTFTNTGLTNGTTYYYQVTAVNVGGESPRSNEVSATPQAPPAPPTGLNATAGNAQVSLTWNASAGAATYNIYRGTVSGSTTLLQSGVTATNFTDTGLTNGTTYYYQVTAVNVGGESPKSNEASATPQGPPAAPTGLSAAPANAQVVLNWNAVSGAATYNIYRGTSSGGATLFQTGVTATTYTDTGLTNGTTYYYQVTAANVGGESARSSEVSATPQAPPAAPTGLSATPGNAQVALTWNASAGAATYNIYRGTVSGSTTLIQSGVTGTSFTDTGLTNGTTYFYQVTAVNVGGESPKSGQVSATPQAPPAAPTGLTAAPGNAQVVLNWNATSGATSYNVYRGTSSGGEVLIQSGVTGTSFTNTGLTNGVTYFYQVTGVNVGGESLRSGEVSATPQAPPAPPTGVSATAGNAQVVLSWNAVAGATSYRVYRGTSSGGETLLQAGLTSTTFTNVGLTNGVTYFYQVTAVNVGGESPRSAEVSATPRAPVSPPIPPPPPPPPSDLVAQLAIGGETNGTAQVFTPSGGRYTAAPAVLQPFGSVTANVRTAEADVDGDGTADTIMVTGPGTAIRVAVVSGANGSTLVNPFDPFGGDFLGGGFVTAADFDGDGRAEFVVTPDQGGGPRISIFSLGAGGAAALRANFLTIEENFRGGARPGAGDVNNDGTPDLVVSAGFLGGPRIVVLNGQRVLSVSNFTSDTDKLVGDFFAFSPELRNGAYVAVGDVDGDGFGDLVLGAGPGGGPEIRIASGQRLLTAGSGPALASPIADFFLAGDLNNRGGVRVAVKDADGDSKADVAVGTGGGQASFARVYLGKDFTSVAEPTTFQDLDPFAGALLADGVYVG